MADKGRSENRPWPDSTSVNEVNSSHIDVRRAEEEFNTLSRQLSNRSANTIRKSTDSFHDAEKGLDVDEEQFNLRDYLTSSNDANQKAGIKHKVVTKNIITWSLTDNMFSEYRGHLGELTGRGSRRIG
jgi:ATP-binding cassette subfamily G (WHITE) protein 2 (SNQ2)